MSKLFMGLGSGSPQGPFSAVPCGGCARDMRENSVSRKIVNRALLNLQTLREFLNGEDFVVQFHQVDFLAGSDTIPFPS